MQACDLRRMLMLLPNEADLVSGVFCHLKFLLSQVKRCFPNFIYVFFNLILEMCLVH